MTIQRVVTTAGLCTAALFRAACGGDRKVEGEAASGG